MTEADKVGEETLGLTQYEKDMQTAFEQRAAALPDAKARSGQSEEAIVAEQFGGQVNDLVDMNEIAQAQDDQSHTGREGGQFDVQGDRSSVPPIKESTGEI